LCQVLGREDWIDHPDFKNEILRRDNRQRLSEMLEAEFGKNTVQHWVDQLNQAGVPAGPVYSVPEVVEDEQVKHLGVVRTLPKSFEDRDMHFITQPVMLSRTPPDIQTAAPACGEHTAEVLKELGYTDEQVKAWQAEGVV
jgi:crotonobetainyl-CoA:carnitine CoA-transferase CaiB-like acyl-CoA transferase